MLGYDDRRALPVNAAAQWRHSAAAVTDGLSRLGGQWLDQIRSTYVTMCVSWGGGLWAIAQISVSIGCDTRTYSAGAAAVAVSSRDGITGIRLFWTIGVSWVPQGHALNSLGFGGGSGFDSFLQQQEQSTPQPQLHRLAGFAVEAQSVDTIGRLANCHISVAQMMTDILTMILTGISYHRRSTCRIQCGLCDTRVTGHLRSRASWIVRINPR